MDPFVKGLFGFLFVFLPLCVITWALSGLDPKTFLYAVCGVLVTACGIGTLIGWKGGYYGP